MAIVKNKPVAKKATPVAKKAAPAKAAPKTAAAANTKLKGSVAGVKKTFDPAGLGQYQDVWAGVVPAERGEYGDITDGKYTARIDEAIIDTGKNGDRLQVKWALTITGPEFANRKVWQNTGLEDQKGMEITKGNLKTLGIESPDDMVELPAVLEEVRNMAVEIALVTREGKGANAGKFYQNCFINKALNADGGAVKEAEAAPVADAVEGEWAGKNVSFVHEDVEYKGTVVSDDGEQAVIAVEGETDQWQIPVNMLEEVVAEAGQDPNDFVGQYVQFTSDGKTYQGDVTGVDKEGNLVVDINGEEWGVGVEDVEIIEKVIKKAAPKVLAKPAMRTIGKK